MALLIKIDGTELRKYPKEFSVTTLDLDDGESTFRTADGTLSRDRVAVKKQIEMSWGVLVWDDIAWIMQAMGAVFFDLYYPDPMEGLYVTKTFYVGNRPAPVAFERDGVLNWENLKVTLTER